MLTQCKCAVCVWYFKAALESVHPCRLNWASEACQDSRGYRCLTLCGAVPKTILPPKWSTLSWFNWLSYTALSIASVSPALPLSFLYQAFFKVHPPVKIYIRRLLVRVVPSKREGGNIERGSEVKGEGRLSNKKLKTISCSRYGRQDMTAERIGLTEAVRICSNEGLVCHVL